MTPDTGDEDDYATFTHSGDKKFQLEDVADEIRRQTDKIGSLADCRALLTSVCTAGDNKQIVADAIVLQLHLQDTVPLTLVDMVNFFFFFFAQELFAKVFCIVAWAHPSSCWQSTCRHRVAHSQCHSQIHSSVQRHHSGCARGQSRRCDQRRFEFSQMYKQANHMRWLLSNSVLM